MKTFEDYWQSLERKNPGLADSRKMTISVESFRRSMQQAFDEGRKSGGLDRSSGIPLFDEIFGKL